MNLSQLLSDTARVKTKMMVWLAAWSGEQVIPLFFIFHFVIHFLRCLSAMSLLRRKGPGGEEEVLGTPRHGRL